MEHTETRSSRTVRQNLCLSEGHRDNFRVSVPTRSAPTSPIGGSPLVSPNEGRNSDFVQYHYVSPIANQFWSAPEMPTSEAGTIPPAFLDLTDTCPLHSPRSRSPHRRQRSSSGTSSPIHPMSSLEISPARRDLSAPSLTVHPLPLPPGAPMVSPGNKPSPTKPKPESSSMKSQWQKGKLIGRGTFGSVYVATNRYI